MLEYTDYAIKLKNGTQDKAERNAAMLESALPEVEKLYAEGKISEQEYEEYILDLKRVRSDSE